MAEEPKRDDSDGEVKGLNIFGRAKEEMEAVLHSGDGSVLPSIWEAAKEEIGAVLRSGDVARHNEHKETHGMRSDINEATPSDDVEAPGVFERAKEEIEAIVQIINAKNHDDSRDQLEKATETLEKSEDEVKEPNLVERVKEEVDAIVHILQEKSHHYHTETHGKNDDIDSSTPADQVKAPNIFEQAKEEIESLVQTIHLKKEPEKESTNSVSSTKSEGGFAATVGRGLETVCASGKDGFAASIGRGLEKICSSWGSKRD